MNLRVRTAAILAFLAVGQLHAQRLPIQSFTIAQGLAGNAVNKIVQDSRGFIWFCTGDGLSRFDGHQFVNFGTAQGLPHGQARGLIETRSGDYWVATDDGLVSMPGNGAFHIEVIYPGEDIESRKVWAVKEASDGTLWVGTDGGLYRMSPGTKVLERIDLPRPETWSDSRIWAIEEDSIGNVWFGSETGGIGRITKKGRVDRWTPRQGLPSYVVITLYKDVDGTIWAGTQEGVCHMLRNPEPGVNPGERCYGLSDGLPGLYTQAIQRTPDGTLWVGTTAGAAFAKPAQNLALRFSALTTHHGLADDDIVTIGADIDGNLWLGSNEDGAMKLARQNITFFNEREGLAHANVIGFFEDQQAQLFAVTRSPRGIVLNRFDGMGFVAIHPNTPARIRAFGRGFQQVALQDHSGKWWIATGDGLLRYPPGDISKLQESPDVLIFSPLPDGGNVFRLYEDSKGDVWWSTSGLILNRLARWNHVTGTVESFSEANGLPPLHTNSPAAFNLPTGFVEDRTGALWLGFQSQGLVRRRKDGNFEYFDPTSSWPVGRIRSSYRDSKGGLWFGSSTGLWRVVKSEEQKPKFHQYTVSNGISSDTVYSVIGDSEDRIYIGTTRGLDRLDPESGNVEHLASADGFPVGIVQAAYRDKLGNLWFATRQGVARFTPNGTSVGVAPPAVRITTIKVRGIDRPLSPAGEAALADMQFAPDEDQIEVDFVVPYFQAEREPLYQYRLEGSRSDAWSPPSTARSVNFASLRPGLYRFVVRATNSQGVPLSESAAVAFRIRPPFWLSWWFSLGIVLVITAMIYGLYCYRMAAILERERLRFRIATDLHDDIGSSLSTIAIWSDLAVRQANENDRVVQPLQQIGAVAREVINSVSDIVWTINPSHDSFSDLASRMRRHAGDLEAGLQFPISFTVDGSEQELRVDPIFRREVFLIFKEALHNVVRHSACIECSISLVVTTGRLKLRIRDNGKGFDSKSSTYGNGLESMRRRAQGLGGVLRIHSRPSQGTVIELDVPIAQKSRPVRIV